MKKIALAVLSLGLLVSGCSAGADKDEKVAEKSGKQKNNQLFQNTLFRMNIIRRLFHLMVEMHVV